jgi:superfamily II DNA or RNA helicase
LPNIYDNIEKKLSTALNDTLEVSSRADFCIGYFNLRGWKEVADRIDALPGAVVREGKDDMKRFCRVLVGMQKLPIDIIQDFFFRDKNRLLDHAEAVKLKKQLAQEFQNQLTIGTPTNEDEKFLRKLSRQMKGNKVAVKLHLRYPLHAKLYIAYSDDKRIPVLGYLGSSNLTLAGLVKQGELNIDVHEPDAAGKLAAWFDERWNDRWCIDITSDLINIIDTSWAQEEKIPPYHIYLKIAWHLSREARAGISEFKLPKVFQKELWDFQQKAVLIAAHHLNKRGGVVIGDVVGLGKTITATAIAKMFEEDFFFETLIICPKNLINMWEEYKEKYRLIGKVISQSMVHRELPSLRRYRLVIIDESHNLRNDEGVHYRAIKAYLEENESKVVLLTATPYNKDYRDLSNQLRLFLPDDRDLGISPERYIESLGGQIPFSAKHTETAIRSIRAFEKSSFFDDWRELMRLYMVRRTRSFIKNNYAETDRETGKKYITFSDDRRSYFPERLPKRLEFAFNDKDAHDIYAQLYSASVVDRINHLELPRYGLQLFLDSTAKIKPSKEEEVLLSTLSRAGRRLMGFCRTNLFKRLESSGFSFLLSLSRHVLRNYIFIYAIQNELPLPIGKNIAHNLDDFLEDKDVEDEAGDDTRLGLPLNESMYLEKAKAIYAMFSGDSYKNRFDWIRCCLFNKNLLKNLHQDSVTILQILKIGKDWNKHEDRKINTLAGLLTETHPQDKVLIFTQFSDTAYYVTEKLLQKGINKIDVVTGSDEDPTAKAYRFSPQSNEKTKIIQNNQDIRILVTTDVLSEGQNLQDAHIIVNFDLPWAIIRLIQRAGRVDRIGQTASQILCYSFLPEEGIEKIINLRSRLARRIKENADVVGSDETFFDGDPVNLEDLYTEKAGIMDGDDDDTEIDLASYAYQIWKNAIDKEPYLAKIVPDLPGVVYSAKANTEKPEYEGTVVYVRTAEDNDVLSWIDRDGKIITQSQYKILNITACYPETKAEDRLVNHHELVKIAIESICRDETNLGGSLGRKSGVKYRLYMRLDRFCKEYEDSLFVTKNLKKAIDDIFKYPLNENTKDIISRQMKAGVSDEQLAEMIVSLRDENKLVISSDDEHVSRGPEIICSLGLINTGAAG